MVPSAAATDSSAGSASAVFCPLHLYPVHASAVSFGLSDLSVLISLLAMTRGRLS